MDKIIRRAENVQQEAEREGEKYQFSRSKVVSLGESRNCKVAVYTIAPGKAAFPYHYHTLDEEVFYVISGEGLLRSPEGEKRVSAGDFMFFPVGEEGAHQLFNASQTENLVYIDFDVCHALEVSVYPDSGKVGIWSEKMNALYHMKDQTEYYSGE